MHTQSILTWDELMNARLRESPDTQCPPPPLFSFAFFLSLLSVSSSISLALAGRWRAAAVVGCEGAAGMCVCVWWAGYSHPSLTVKSSPSIPELHTPCKPAVLLTNTLFCLFRVQHISSSLHHLFRLNTQLWEPTIYGLYYEFIA